MTLTDPEPIHTCSPHKLRKLVYTVLSESQAIDLDFKPLKSESEKVKEIKNCDVNELDEEKSNLDTAATESFPVTSQYTANQKTNLKVYDVRKLNGCLLRVPEDFYTTIWHILTKVKGGIQISSQHMPQEPTITIMTSTEMRFAYAFESMLNVYDEDPAYKQITVEFFTVLCKIMKRHPEFSFIDTINVDKMINQAIKLFSEDRNVNLEEGRENFLRETVANTSIYIGKAIIVSLLDSKSLSNFASNASTSEFKCKVQ